MKKPTYVTNISAFSANAAKVSFGAAVAFLILLTVLHFFKPEFNPTWHMISEYSIGNYGWLMQIAFFCIALSCIALAAALAAQVKTVGARIALGFFALAAIGMTVAGFNVTDPIGTPASEMSAHGNMHGIGFMIGVPSLTLAITTLAVSLRRNQAWTAVTRRLAWLAGLAWAGIAGMGFVFAVLLPHNNGVFGPSVMVGLPNRLYIIASCLWLASAAWYVVKLYNKKQTN